MLKFTKKLKLIKKLASLFYPCYNFRKFVSVYVLKISEENYKHKQEVSTRCTEVKGTQP